MKVLPFKVIKTAKESFLFQIDDQKWFYDSLHQHPEIQIMYIEKGRGSVIAGDYVGNFKEGELYVIGSNQPHVFRSNPEYYDESNDLKVKAIHLFIHKELFGKEFISMPELVKVNYFLDESDLGFLVGGESKTTIIDLIKSMVYKEGLSRIIGLLEILQHLSDFATLKTLSNLRANYEKGSEGTRMNNIYSFTFREFARSIQLEELASISNMTVTSFCRYFKQRTRKKLLHFFK